MLTGSSSIISSNNQYSRRKCFEVMVISNSVPNNKHEETFFSIRMFFHRHCRFRGQQGKVGYHHLFHTTTSTMSQTFRNLFVTLHVRWLSIIFNHNACIYQIATRWDLQNYWITIIWLMINVCLIDRLFTWWFDFRLVLQQFDTGNRWIWACIDHHPCITSEPTNQVCQKKTLKNWRQIWGEN